MSKDLSSAEPESRAALCLATIRAAVQREHDPLLRTVAVLVARSDRGLRWPQVLEIASEVLQDAVHEALKHAGSFDPSRSAAAWIRGIAAKLLLARRRLEGRDRRCVSATVLGHEGWAAALGQLCDGSADGAVAGRLDLEQALGRLSDQDRRAIELRYYQGLDGEELANALGVRTPGAARVRVCRALGALRDQFSPVGEEVVP